VKVKADTNNKKHKKNGITSLTVFDFDLWRSYVWLGQTVAER